MARPPNPTLWVVAVVAGLVAMMLVAVVMPRMTGSEETNWLISILAAVIVGGAVAAYGYGRADSGTTERTPPPQH
jgi:protein-S-isoprenylcysteine O-methyltransferase Ste14